MKVGIDTLNFNRIKNIEKFAKKVLSTDELSYFLSITNEKRKIEYVAGRFSLKESFIKAANIKDVSFKEISILNDEYGRPNLIYSDFETSVSISHEKDHVVTICVIE